MRRGSGGWSLIEHLAAMALIGGLLVSVLPVAHQVRSESVRASGHAHALATRWETVRRIRSDAARASQARALQGATEAGTGVELRDSFGSVIWTVQEGLLHRAASPGPIVQGVPVQASFAVESRKGRTFVLYELEDELGTVSGSVLVGSAP